MSDSETQISLKATIDETEKGDQSALAAVAKKFQWKDVPESERPSGPREDYIRQVLPMPRGQLLERWEGLEKDWEIEDLFRWGETHRQKMVLKEMMESGEPVLDVADPKFQKRLNERDFLLIDSMFQKEAKMYLEGIEPDVKTVYNETSKQLKRKEGSRSMNAKDRLASARTMATLQNEKRLLGGQATQIVRIEEVNMGPEKQQAAQERLKAFRLEMNAAGQVNAYELPPAESQPLLQGRVLEALPEATQLQPSQHPHER